MLSEPLPDPLEVVLLWMLMMGPGVMGCCCGIIIPGYPNPVWLAITNLGGR